jgi:penicillin G amidase
MFDSESTVSLEQIDQTENVFGYDLGVESGTEETSAGGNLDPDVEEIDATNSSGESGGETSGESNSSVDSANQDSITGNSGDEPLVGEVQSEDSLLNSQAKETKETLTLSGVNEEVTVDLDNSGIPHINAQTDEDAFFAQGYMHARDLLYQMEINRRQASGTLSEVAGEEALEGDIEARTKGYNQLGESAYQNLTSETKDIVDAYAAGINDYLNSNPNLPAEFEGNKPELWDPVDVMVISQADEGGDGGETNNAALQEQGLSQERIEELNVEREDSPTIIQSEDANQLSTAEEAESTTKSTTETETTQLSSSTSADESEFSELTEPEFNSNSWVISGSKTTTGKPILATDPHGELNSPSSAYQTSLESPNFDVVGTQTPGTPGILIGRNNDISWGVTSSGVDSEDFYTLEETEDGSGYIYQGKVQPYEIREETIKVKDGETVTIEVQESVYGPEVSDVLGVEQPVALKSVALEPGNGSIEATIGVNQASNWDEFTGSLESITTPNYNFVYGDVEGNIGSIAPGNYPIRQPGHTGDFPVAGTGESDWQGYIPKEDVPQEYNPESGYIVASNNKITPDNYPYEINGEFGSGYRAERITELINSKDKVSVEDMQDFQLDTESLLYRDLKPILEKIEPTSEQGKYWRDRLLAWDGELTLDSQEATVFESWYTELTRLGASEIEDEYYNNSAFIIEGIQSGDSAFDNPGSEPGTYDDVAQAFEASIKRFGEEIPAWGDVQKASFEPLNESQSAEPLQVPFNGGTETVNVSAYDEETFVTKFGARYRQIVDLNNPEDSLYVNPSGQSSDPNSENYADQLDLWQEGKYVQMR